LQHEIEQLRQTVAELEGFKARCEQLEKSLKQSEERFFQLFHASSNPMAITILTDGLIVDVNEAYIRFSGYQRQELIGHRTAELGLWADPKQRDFVVKKLREEGKVHDLKMGVLTKTGDSRTVLFSAGTITISGEPCLFSAAIDLTECKRAEEAQRESEEKYRILVENSLQGLAIMQDSCFVFCNKAFAEITGHSVEELLSLSSNEIMAMIHPDNQAFIGGYIHDRIGGKPIPARYEFRGIKKNGTEVWLEIYSSLIEYKGKPAIQSAFLDITERKQADEKLRMALAWQEAIFEGSRDPILISDVDARFVDANAAACRLTGYSKEELLKMNASDLQQEKDLAQLQALHNRILAGEGVQGETKIYTKDDRKVDVEFTHLRLIMSGMPYVHSLARDISTRKRLEAQFLQAQKMEAIGVLAGGVAHDFNNLLTVINGYSEIMLGELAQDDRKRRDIERILQAGQSAASLTSQLLAFSRKQILYPRILNLQNAVADMSSMIRRLIGEDIEFLVRTQLDLGLVNADPGQIQQIIMNLVVNARDAMPQGGKLTIETGNVDIKADHFEGNPVVAAGPYVTLSISDNGMGMDAATQARIFEPFFTTKSLGKGTGLGLSTVYGIVKQSNGFIMVHSEPRKGTTFTIYLPQVEEEMVKLTGESRLERGSRGSETVLVVEDEAPVRALACRILRDRNYRVIEAADGGEALRIAGEFAGEIQLVLTDVVMPGINGRTMVSRLKASRPGIKVLYVSGYTDNAVVHDSMLASNVAFLQKPFTPDSLASKVFEMINCAPTVATTPSCAK
jgi:PAS domain S-box-containing protein